MATTLTELKDRLATTKGAKIVTIVTKTEPDMVKKGNPYAGKVTKISRVNGVINFNYERSVNRQREREDKEANFEAVPRRWGHRIQGTPLVEHNGNNYLEMKVERVITTEYFDKDTGKQIDPAELREFLREKVEGIRQEVDRPIILRDYRLDHISKIFLEGEEISLDADSEVAKMNT